MPALNNIHSIFKCHPVPTLILNPCADYCINGVNDAFLIMTGLASADLLNESIFSLLSDQDLINGSSSLKAALDTVTGQWQTEKVRAARYNVAKKKGTDNKFYYWEIGVSPVLTEEGKLLNIICAINDVTHSFLKQENAIVQLSSTRTFEGIKAPVTAAPWPMAKDEIEGALNYEYSAKELLQISESNLRAIFNNSIEGFVLTDTCLNIKAFNTKAAEYVLFKNQAYELKTGENLLNYIESPWNEYFKKQVSEVLRDNVIQYQRPLYKEGQGFLCFSFSISPVKENGKITGLCISGRDITRQKQAEDRLEKSEKKFRALIEHSAEGILLLSPNGIIDYVSLSVIKITGYLLEELLDINLSFLIYPEDVQDFISSIAAVKEVKKCQENKEYRYVHKDGSVRWMELAVTNMIHEESINGIVINFRDVTERKTKDLKIFELNAQLISAQKIAKLGYWQFDVASNQLFWSDEHYEIWGLPKAPSISFEAFINTVYKEDRVRLLDYHSDTIAGKHETDVSYRIVGQDFQVKYIHALAKSIWKEGEIVRFEGTVQDVTEQILAKEATDESEKKYRKIFENSPLPNWIIDTQTLKIVEVNEAAIRCYGFYKEEFLRFTILDFMPIEENGQLPDALKNATWDQSSLIGHWRHKKKNGHLIDVEVTSHGITLNKKQYILLIANDITERLNIENELLQSNERFQLATKATSDAIWDYDLLNDKIYLGDGFHTLFGVESHIRLVNNTWLYLQIHEDDYETVWKGVGKALNDPASAFWKCEHRYRKANGEFAVVCNEAVIVRRPDGKPYRMIGAMKDITLAKKEEERLRQMESVITNTTDAVIITSATFEEFMGPEILFINDAFLNMTGFCSEDVLGKRTAILTGPETDQREIAKLQQAMRKGESCSIQTKFYRKNKETYWASLAIAPVIIDPQPIQNYIAICRDISEIINYVHEIEEQNEKLKEIAWIQSHVVRAPLSRILGLADIMSSDPGDGNIDELLPFMVESANELDCVIKDIVYKTQKFR